MASIVVIAAVPTLSMVVMQERVAVSSIRTVHAPHSALPQPNLVPVMPSTSRSTQSRGVSPSTSTGGSTALPLFVSAMVTSTLRRVVGHDRKSCGSRGHTARNDGHLDAPFQSDSVPAALSELRVTRLLFGGPTAR